MNNSVHNCSTNIDSFDDNDNHAGGEKDDTNAGDHYSVNHDNDEFDGDAWHDDDEWMFKEKGNATVNLEFWDISKNEINSDFCGDNTLPNVNVNVSTNQTCHGQRPKSIIRWTLIFLFLWAAHCSISMNALEILLGFLRAMLEALSTLFPLLAPYNILALAMTILKSLLCVKVAISCMNFKTVTLNQMGKGYLRLVPL